MNVMAIARRARWWMARLVCVATVAFCVAPATHAGIAATVLPIGCYAVNGCHYFVMNDVAGYRGDTPQHACDNFAQKEFAWLQPTAKVISGTSTNTGYACTIYASNGTYYSGGGIYYVGPLATASSCPAHSTLNPDGVTCSCDNGWFPDATGTQCVQPSNRVALKGPSRTKALVAGPALAQTASVTDANGAGVSGVSVSINIAGAGSIGGLTNANGSFEFVYVPPARATVDHLAATCGNCTNTAEKDITVDPCDVCEPTVGNPIQPASGEKLQAEVDWLDVSPHPLTIRRTYRSFGAPWSGLGGNWSHPWSATAMVLEVEATIRLGDGRRVNFRRPSPQLPWAADGLADSLSAVPEGFVYRRASDGSSFAFDPQGRLSRITQRNGWAMTVQRDAGGNVAAVTNAFGRSLVFEYAGSALVAITTPDGSRIAYGFDAAGRLVSASFPDAKSRAYLYEDGSQPGALTGIVDERGVRVASFTYDARGYATSTQHAGALSFAVNYTQPADARGRLVAGTSVDSGVFRTSATVTDPLGTPRGYEWVGGDGHVYMVGASAAGGMSGFASRGIDNLPTHETDFAGVSTTFAWDVPRRVKTQQTEAAGRPEARSTFTEWHPIFDLPTKVTEPGRVTEYTYDALGNRLSEAVTDTQSNVTRTRRWAYDARSLVVSETDAAGKSWQYGYDAAGNRTSVTDPLGQTSTSIFNAAGRVLRTTDPAGVVTAYTYDARGRITQQQRGDEVVSYAYSATGQLARMALANGYEVAYVYDAADRLVQASDSRGASITYTLDGAGNRVREEVKDANGNIAYAVSKSMDSLGRVAASQGAAGDTTQYAYDANGEPVATTDPLNQTTRQALDALRRPTSITFPDNASASQAWNAQDAVTQVTDPKGVQTRYEVNAFGEVTRETSPDSGATTYERDSAGNVVATTDARGRTARIVRDALGRPVEVRYDDQTQFFTYDPQGNVSRIEDASGSTSYVRDANGRVVTKTLTVNDNPSAPSRYVVQYGYIAGDLTSIRYPSGILVIYRRTAGRVTRVDVQRPGAAVQPFVTDLVYTPLGQPKSWRWYNGDTAARTFDANGRMLANEFATYTWDAASRITGITQRLWAMSGTQLTQIPVTWTVGYDSRNRIASMTRNGQSTAFTYDANSNRVSKLEITTGEIDLESQFDSAGISLSTSETPRIDAGSNRLLGFSITATATGGSVSSTATNDVNYTVDAAGNMTSDGLRTFTYDGANRPSKVLAIRGGDSVGYEYLHNALGQRVFKSDAMLESTTSSYAGFGSDFLNWLKANFGWLYSNTQPTARTGLAFIHDEQGNLLATQANGSNYSLAQQMEYIWLPLEDGTAIPIGLYRGWQFQPVHTDHLGTPRLVTDVNKKPVWQWPYSAFGANKPTGVLNTVTTTNAAGVTTTQLKATTPGFDHMLRFAGQYCDVESALCQNWWRYVMQRGDGFTQMDPSGLPAGSNRRIYGNANSLSYVDYDGKVAFAPMMYWMAGAGAAAWSAWMSTPSGQDAASDLAKRIVSLCTPSDPCDELLRQANDIAGKLRSKIAAQTADRYKLFQTAFARNPGGALAGKGTWMGHDYQISSLKIGLQRKLAELQAAGCPIPADLVALANTPNPAGTDK